MSHEPILW